MDSKRLAKTAWTHQTAVPQACAIGFRWDEGALQFCLVTARKSGHWIYPKGHVAGYSSSAAAAQDEARQEAGILGRLLPEPLDDYHYQKRGCSYRVTPWLLWVQETRNAWPESDVRRRIWSSPEEALLRVRAEELRHLTLAAVARLQFFTEPNAATQRNIASGVQTQPPRWTGALFSNENP